MDEEPLVADLPLHLPHLSQHPSYRGDSEINLSRTFHHSTGTNLKDGEEENLVINNRFEKYSHYNADSSRPIGFGLKRPVQPSSVTNTITGLEEIFASDEIIDITPIPKKMKLTVIDEKTKMNAPNIEYGPESVKYLTPQERTKKIKKLIDKIPTDKASLFSYDVKWFLVDQKLIDKRVKPWLRKKIFDYIGEEETTLIKYICQKVFEKCQPEIILKDISMILDDEAEIFVIKLWRLLIYETEAKSMGLVQD
ncbi:hypothetical protein MXB_2185 [Myxobolus squamalis]|nr:hypothetical protein MXB_2185 [Myxobolus squamalis]